MKGIILVGGFGIWLYFIMCGVLKQFLVVYDKLMIYYLLLVLMLVGICEILIIIMLEDKCDFQCLLGDGVVFGIDLYYVEQFSLDGLVQVFIIGEMFFNGEFLCLVLGDNIFFGQGFSFKFCQVVVCIEGVIVFGYQVMDLECFGVVEFDDDFCVFLLEEKLKQFKFNWVVIGFYFYDSKVVEYVKCVKLFGCGELEIIFINQMYLEEGKLIVELLGCGFVWLDMGIYDSLIEVSIFVQMVEKCQGFKIVCLEEIVWCNGWLDDDGLKCVVSQFEKIGYG